MSRADKEKIRRGIERELAKQRRLAERNRIAVPQVPENPRAMRRRVAPLGALGMAFLLNVTSSALPAPYAQPAVVYGWTLLIVGWTGIQFSDWLFGRTWKRRCAGMTILAIMAGCLYGGATFGWYLLHPGKAEVVVQLINGGPGKSTEVIGAAVSIYNGARKPVDYVWTLALPKVDSVQVARGSAAYLEIVHRGTEYITFEALRLPPNQWASAEVTFSEPQFVVSSESWARQYGYGDDISVIKLDWGAPHRR